MHKGKTGLIPLFCAACLALAPSASPARTGVVRVSPKGGGGESKRAPIGVALDREEAVRRIAEHSKRFVTERGVASTAEALRRLAALRPKSAPPSPLAPDADARWLASADVAGIEDLYCSDPDLMDAAAYALFVAQYGIEFRYVLDDAGTEGDILQCGDLDEAIAHLLAYTDEVLYYLGHASPKMQVRILAPGLTLMCGIYEADGCCSWNVVSLAPNRPDVIVHETAHALHFLGINSNQSDPLNPLKGMKPEFDALFTLPPDLDALITYDNWLWGNPLDGLPDGYTDMYAVVNILENFAQTCTYYVGMPEKFLMKAHKQAWNEQILLALKYRFCFQRVFRYRDFTDLFPPQSAIVSLETVDQGDGDGRIEPGEYFSMDLHVVPLYDFPGIHHLRCEPWETTTTVVSVATSEMVNGLQKGKRYDFPGAFQFRLSPYFTGETNRTFMLRYYLPDGSLANLGWDFVPLNERGYVWAWDADWPSDATIVKLTSTMKLMDAVQWPEALLSAMQAEHTVFDPAGGCIWICPIYPTGSILRVPIAAPASFTSIPIDPDGNLQADEIAGMERNPADGSLWLRTDATMVTRISFGPGGAVGRLVIDPPEFSEDSWPRTRDMAVDPKTGRIWLVSENEVLRLSPSGQVELDADGFSGIWEVAPAADGGCWIGTAAKTLVKVSAAGAAQSSTNLGNYVSDLVFHPFDGSLWGRLGTACYKVDQLVRFSSSGTPLSSWAIPGYSHEIVPSAADATVYAGKDEPRGARRYQAYGGPLHTTMLNLHEYRPFAYQAAP